MLPPLFLQIPRQRWSFGVSISLLRHGNGQSGSAGLRLQGVWIVTRKQVQADLRTAHTLTAQRERQTFEMLASWIQVRRIAQPKFEVHRSSDTYHFGEFV